MAIAAIIQNKKVLNSMILEVKVSDLRFLVTLSHESSKTIKPMEPSKDKISIVTVISEFSLNEVRESLKRLKPAVQKAETL